MQKGNEERGTLLFGGTKMKKEYDFSKGERGKFYRKGLKLNINGAIDIDHMSCTTVMDDSVNAQSTIKLLKKIERKHKKSEKIYVICDHARYYRSCLVKEYLKDSKIELVFLPPYAANLNLIERYWKYFKKIVLYNRYYEKFDDFKTSCELFFKNIKQHKTALRSLLTENFHIVGKCTC